MIDQCPFKPAQGDRDQSYAIGQRHSAQPGIPGISAQFASSDERVMGLPVYAEERRDVIQPPEEPTPEIIRDELTTGTAGPLAPIIDRAFEGVAAASPEEQIATLGPIIADEFVGQPYLGFNRPITEALGQSLPAQLTQRQAQRLRDGFEEATNVVDEIGLSGDPADLPGERDRLDSLMEAVGQLYYEPIRLKTSEDGPVVYAYQNVFGLNPGPIAEDKNESGNTWELEGHPDRYDGAKALFQAGAEIFDDSAIATLAESGILPRELYDRFLETQPTEPHVAPDYTTLADAVLFFRTLMRGVGGESNLIVALRTHLGGFMRRATIADQRENDRLSDLVARTNAYMGRLDHFLGVAHCGLQLSGKTMALTNQQLPTTTKETNEGEHKRDRARRMRLLQAAYPGAIQVEPDGQIKTPLSIRDIRAEQLAIIALDRMSGSYRGLQSFRLELEPDFAPTVAAQIAERLGVDAAHLPGFSGPVNFGTILHTTIGSLVQQGLLADLGTSPEAQFTNALAMLAAGPQIARAGDHTHAGNHALFDPYTANSTPDGRLTPSAARTVLVQVPRLVGRKVSASHRRRRPDNRERRLDEAHRELEQLIAEIPAGRDQDLERDFVRRLCGRVEAWARSRPLRTELSQFDSPANLGADSNGELVVGPSGGGKNYWTARVFSVFDRPDRVSLLPVVMRRAPGTVPKGYRGDTVSTQMREGIEARARDRGISPERAMADIRSGGVFHFDEAHHLLSQPQDRSVIRDTGFDTGGRSIVAELLGLAEVTTDPIYLPLFNADELAKPDPSVPPRIDVSAMRLLLTTSLDPALHAQVILDEWGKRNKQQDGMGQRVVPVHERALPNGLYPKLEAMYDRATSKTATPHDKVDAACRILATLPQVYLQKILLNDMIRRLGAVLYCPPASLATQRASWQDNENPYGLGRRIRASVGAQFCVPWQSVVLENDAEIGQALIDCGNAAYPGQGFTGPLKVADRLIQESLTMPGVIHRGGGVMLPYNGMRRVIDDFTG